MVMVYQCDTFCDVCMDWIGGEGTQWDTSVGLAKSAQEIAKGAGWIRKLNPERRYEDICPECQAKGLTSKAQADAACSTDGGT